MDPSAESNDRLKSRVQALRSGNRTVMLETVKQLRVDGNISILPVILEVFSSQEDKEVIREITGLLNDLKDPDAAPLLAEAIGDPDYKEVLPQLVAACWQNGLSYSDYLDIFVDVVVKEKYEVAIEAFTVIEENLEELGPVRRAGLVETLKLRKKETDREKTSLISELIKIAGG